MESKRLLLDVGGTFIKCSDGRTVPIDSAGDREGIAGALQEAVGETRPSIVAVAIPGPFDYDAGIFRMEHKFAAVYGERFRTLAGLPEDIPVRYIHDVNCMLLGALRLPEVKPFRKVALTTLGTGLGFAFALDGHLQCSPDGSPARNLWNRPYLDGIAEDYASKRGVLRAYSEVSGLPLPEGATVKSLAMKAYAGYDIARGTFLRVGAHLGAAIAPLLRETGIECLLVGGQIAKSFSLMEPSLRESLASVPGLQKIQALPNLDSATFDGLETLCDR